MTTIKVVVEKLDKLIDQEKNAQESAIKLLLATMCRASPQSSSKTSLEPLVVKHEIIHFYASGKLV